MKRNLKILGCFIIIFALEIYFSIISNAAIETKAGAYTSVTQVNAYQLCYDMRNPTSSLGNNSLDPHLELNKDFAAWGYLGMSAYGNNSKNKTVLTYYSSTTNITGVLASKGTPPSCITAGILDTDGTSNLVSKYGKTKYIETFDNNYMTSNTKGQALMEISGWYQNPTMSTYNKVFRRYGSTYQCVSGMETETGLFRPIIWN